MNWKLSKGTILGLALLVGACAGVISHSDSIRLRPTTLPTTGFDGELRYDTATELLKLWTDTGGTWDTVGGGGTDADAIHDNVPAEISAITAKGTPVSADFLLIEDSADSDNKKRITIGGLPFADTDLGNLTIPTAINTSLISDTDITDDLGSMAIRWKDIFAERGVFTDITGKDALVFTGDTTLGFAMPSGGNTSVGIGSGEPDFGLSLGIRTFNNTMADANGVAPIKIMTGENTNGGASGAGGNIQLRAGPNAGSGTKAKILLEASDGAIDITGHTIFADVATLTPGGTTQTIDWGSDYNNVTLDLGSASGDVTLTLSGDSSGDRAVYYIKVIQGATTRNLIWPATVDWPGGTAPTITAADDSVDLIKLYFDGARYLGTFDQDFQ